MSLLRLQRDLTLRPWSIFSLFPLKRPLSVITRRPPKKRDPVLRITSSPLETIQTQEDFLKTIGRESEKKLSVKSWTQFWNMDGRSMREAGVGVKDRRYILWCKEKYRLGFPINEFAHEPPTKKTVRGWGPKVQNGKRIRSRRIKTK